MKNSILIALCALFAVACSPKPQPIGPTPSAQQLAWHEMEQYAFIHFSINTFTNKEWGYGDESPNLFNPTDLDADQWVRVIQEAGMKGVILTCKHHDGFALWPSAYTEHSVKNSPYKQGKGDVVREVAEACKRYGLKFGVYLSPWDRNHPDYGTPEYVTYYRNQLTELFTQYGPIFEMWFDGANGGDGYYGGKRDVVKINGATYYDWPTTLKLVRTMEPKILFFSDAGPEIRWVGNERGIAGETNWNTITPDTLHAGKAGIEPLLQTGHPEGTHWIPAEVDVSIRPGWFYHAEEDQKVKTPEQLFAIYLSSVGRGSNLLLNIPPDRRGKIHEEDVKALQGWTALLKERLSQNLISAGKVEVSSESRGWGKSALVDDNKNTHWMPKVKDQIPMISITFNQPTAIKYLQIQEGITYGQRVSAFEVESFDGSSWNTIAKGTTIGYKRILPLPNQSYTALRVRLVSTKAVPIIKELAVF